MNNLHTRLAKRRYSTVTLTDGTVVRLRSLTRSEQRQWKTHTKDVAAEQFSDDVLLALCIVDDDGNQVISCEDALTGFFDVWDMADCQALLRGCYELLFVQPITKSAVEDALKNSKATTGNGSSGSNAIGSASRSTNSINDSILTTF